jgi:hypothetical protein
MVFEHVGSKHALAEDQQVCDQALLPKWARYVNTIKGRLDPWWGLHGAHGPAAGGPPGAARDRPPVLRAFTWKGNDL